MSASTLASTGSLLGFWIPGLHAWPWPMSARTHLLLFLPLVLCIALVYRATRARRARDLLWPTLVAFLNITLGMVAIAVGFYVVYEIVIRM